MKNDFSKEGIDKEVKRLRETYTEKPSAMRDFSDFIGGILIFILACILLAVVISVLEFKTFGGKW